MGIHEMYGRLAEQHGEECARHHRTIDLLRQIAAGEVDPGRLVVTEDTWTVIPADAPILKAVDDDVVTLGEEAVGEIERLVRQAEEG